MKKSIVYIIAFIIALCLMLRFCSTPQMQDTEKDSNDEDVTSEEYDSEKDEGLTCYYCSEEIIDVPEYTNVVDGTRFSLCHSCARSLCDSRTPLSVNGEEIYIIAYKQADNGKMFWFTIPYFFDEYEKTETYIILECYDGNGETIIVEWEDLYSRLQNETESETSRELLNIGTLLISSSASEILDMWEISYTSGVSVWSNENVIYIVAYCDADEDGSNDFIHIVTLKDGVKYQYSYFCGENMCKDHIADVFELVESAYYPTMEYLEKYWG